MKLSRPLASYFTYTLGKSLYVPLTSRSNTKTLPETRGPNFLLGAEVVAALCRVRDAELGTEQWKHWCMYLDTQETPQKVPLPLDLVDSLPTLDGERLPRINDLIKEIHDQLKVHPDFDSIVLAGEGEPTLRLEEMLELVRTIKSSLSPSQRIRLTTNGLVSNPEAVVAMLQDAGVDAVSVALMTASADQYDQLMTPILSSKSHKMVCDFIEAAIKQGIEVESTGVDRSEVDKGAAEDLSKSLRVKSSMRWRPYFP